jgi:hypothetical protein
VAFDGDASAVALHRAPHAGKSKAGAASALLGGENGSKM